MDNMDDLIFLEYQVNIEAKLRETALFYEYEICIGRMVLALQDNKIEFLEYGGSFPEDVFRKSIDEAAGFIGCLKMGSFYSSFHHVRALIELYATVSFCFSEKDQSQKMFERYARYAELELSRMTRAIEKGEASWGFSDSQKQKLKESHSVPSIEALQVFGFQTMEKYEEDRKKRTSTSWMGGITLTQLLSKLHDSHSKNYEKLCNFAHFSALIKRSNTQSWGLPLWWEELLTATVKYTFDIYDFIRESECLSKTSIETLDKIYSRLGPELNSRVSKALSDYRESSPEDDSSTQ